VAATVASVPLFDSVGCAAGVASFAVGAHADKDKAIAISEILRIRVSVTDPGGGSGYCSTALPSENQAWIPPSSSYTSSKPIESIKGRAFEERFPELQYMT